MGGFLGIGGSSAKTDRNTQGGGTQGLWNVFNYALPFAQDTNKQGTQKTDTGFGSLEDASKFFKTIMSGDRTAFAKAEAPAVNAVNEAADMKRKQEAWFGTQRGGGTNAANQQLDTQVQSTIDNARFAAMPAAAQQVGQLGQAESNVGLNQIQEGLRALGLSEAATAEIVDSAIRSRPISAVLNKQVQDQWRQVILNALTLGGGGAPK